MKYAVTDIGSNTIRLCIYELENGKINTLINNKEHTQLAQYIENGVISDEGIEAAIAAVLKHKNTIEKHNIKNPMFFATAALRNIKNSKEAVGKISEKSGVSITVISGEEEAACDFYGATCDFSLSEGIVCDIGGGSSEIVYFKNKKMSGACSLPIGSLNSFKNFVSGDFPTAKERENLCNEVESLFYNEDLFDVPQRLTLCGIGGSICSALSLYNFYYNLDDNMDMNVEKFNEMLEKMLVEENKREIFSLISKDRIFTMLPGMIIFDKILSLLEISEIKVTYKGVREGYLLRRLEESDAF